MLFNERILKWNLWNTSKVNRCDKESVPKSLKFKWSKKSKSKILKMLKKDIPTLYIVLGSYFRSDFSIFLKWKLSKSLMMKKWYFTELFIGDIYMSRKKKCCCHVEVRPVTSILLFFSWPSGTTLQTLDTGKRSGSASRRFWRSTW